MRILALLGQNLIYTLKGGKTFFNFYLECKVYTMILIM